jgi:hypothetical protein
VKRIIMATALAVVFAAPAQASEGIGKCQSQAAKQPGVSVPGEVSVCPLPQPNGG